jgi:hypothetical protein
MIVWVHYFGPLARQSFMVGAHDGAKLLTCGSQEVGRENGVGRQEERKGETEDKI